MVGNRRMWENAGVWYRSLGGGEIIEIMVMKRNVQRINRIRMNYARRQTERMNSGVYIPKKSER